MLTSASAWGCNVIQDTNRARRSKNLSLSALVLITLAASPVAGQILRNPTGVNVSSVGPTSVLISYANLNGYVAAEAVWCGELEPAFPARGNRCDPATVFGSLPARYSQLRYGPTLPTARSETMRTAAFGDAPSAVTDVMSIPASVARRAYAAALAGASSEFFYVRRFTDATGQRPDEFVTVTCRMTDGGARTPFSLVDVRLSFDRPDPVTFVEQGQPLPPSKAEISYTGSGRLSGRWELVLPGDESPSAQDLLPEGSLPGDQRGSQRRYTEVSRFSVMLPPVGEYTLPGPDPLNLPTNLPGNYQILLRVEATDDKEGDSNLGAIGAGEGVLHSGALAGFALPVLPYFVTSSQVQSLDGLRLLSPAEGADVSDDTALNFVWNQDPNAIAYRIEIRTVRRENILWGVVPGGIGEYQAPTWLRRRAAGEDLEWRVLLIVADEVITTQTPWRRLRWSQRPVS